jgi:hypothetical protein
VPDDPAEVRERLDVVDDRGALEEPLLRRIGRAGGDHAAQALERAQKRGLLAAHVRARPLDDVDVEGLAEDPRLARGRHRPAQRGHRARVLRADVDETARRADGVTAQRDALEDGERILLHQILVDVRTRVAFVRVANDVRLAAVLGVRRGEAPLARRREACAAAPSDLRRLDLGKHLVGRHRCPRLGEPLERAVRARDLEPRRVDALREALEHDRGTVVNLEARNEHVLGLAKAASLARGGRPQIPREGVGAFPGELAVDLPLDLDRRSGVAEAEAVHLFERHGAVMAHLADAQAERVLHPADRGVAARRMARRPFADSHAYTAAARGAEVAVVGRDAVHRRLGLARLTGDARDILGRDNAAVVHHLLQPLKHGVVDAKVPPVSP